MMVEETLARRRVLARRAAQRLDEADQRGERRAQLVAGIGDEIGAQSLAALHIGEIVQHQHRGGAFRRRRRQGREPRRERALDRAGDLELDDAQPFAAQHCVGRVQNRGVAQRAGEIAIDEPVAEQLHRRFVGADDAAVGAEQQHRLGQCRLDCARRRKFRRTLLQSRARVARPARQGQPELARGWAEGLDLRHCRLVVGHALHGGLDRLQPAQQRPEEQDDAGIAEDGGEPGRGRIERLGHDQHEAGRRKKAMTERPSPRASAANRSSQHRLRDARHRRVERVRSFRPFLAGI